MPSARSRNRTRLISLLLFVGCLIIYVLNDRLMISGDSIPTSLWTFNLLENHALTFNNLANQPLFARGLNYYFIKHANGDWITMYPVGTAILTAPLYVLFYLHFKLIHAGAPLNLLQVDFETQRREYERLAAAILASGSVLIFFHIVKTRFKTSIALISAIIFGFATTTWTVSSQALWQHGTLNFSVLASLLALLQPRPLPHLSNALPEGYSPAWEQLGWNRENWQHVHSSHVHSSQVHSSPINKPALILTGVFCGLLLGIRPTAIVYIIPAILYVGFTQVRGLYFFGLGLLSCLPALAWNLYYFGNFFGGYSSLSGFHKLKYFMDTASGILFSPSRGFLIYSPICLFSFPGCIYLIRNFRRSLYQSLDGLLLGTFAMSWLVLLSYCFVSWWWAGYGYGPRFLTDVLPAFCLMLAYCLEWLTRISWRSYWRSSLQTAFAATLVISMLTQLLGIAMPVNAADWNAIPYPIDIQPKRAWQWSDAQILRHMRALTHQPIAPKLLSPKYIANFKGRITGLEDELGQPIDTNQTLQYQTSPITNRSYIILRPQLTNLGTQPWYGYQSGLQQGMIYVRGKLFDRQNQLIHHTFFYLSQRCKPKQTAEAIGAFVLPKSVSAQQYFNWMGDSSENPEYRLVLELGIYGVEMAPVDTYEVKIHLAEDDRPQAIATS